jgi:ankyrin repeat protein
MSELQALLDAIRHDSLVGIRKYLESHSVDLNATEVLFDDYDQDEPDELPLLFWVIQIGASREVIELLIQHGLDITQLNREGVGALDLAIRRHRMDLIELCVAHGIDVRISRRRSGLTPLMLAASFSHFDTVDYLIAQGASVNDRDKRGTDAIAYARVLGQNKMVEYLEKLKKGSQKEKQGV